MAPDDIGGKENNVQEVVEVKDYKRDILEGKKNEALPGKPVAVTLQVLVASLWSQQGRPGAWGRLSPSFIQCDLHIYSLSAAYPHTLASW